jgi:hypothetical protein
MSIQTKVTQKNATETASQFGGGVAGAMLSRGVITFIHDDATNPASGLNKAKLFKQLGLGVVALAGSMFIKADDVLSAAAKGSLQGMAIMQGADAVATYAASTSTAATLAASTSKKDRFIAKSLGLNCPDYGMGRPRRRALRSPELQIPLELVGDSYQSNVKSLDAIFQNRAV